jgi:WD40 repeat protein
VFLSPGDWMATGCWDKVVGIWDLNARTKTPLRLTHPAMLASICASPDGHWLATLAEDGLVRIWDASQLKLLKRTCDKLERSPLPSQQKSHEPREARQLRPPNLHMAAN